MIGWIALGWLACSGPPESCDVVAIAREQAGPGAVDCGSAAEGAHDQVAACRVQALADGADFFGLVEVAGTDSLLVRGLVRSEGELWQVVGDFYACTAEGCRGRVERFACSDALVQEVDGVSDVVCELAEPVCGEHLCGALVATPCGG
jgi:hypothetical protein